MNVYKVTVLAGTSPLIWSVSAQYWTYDTEFAMFYVDPVEGSKQPRETVFAVPLTLNPIVELTQQGAA